MSYIPIEKMIDKADKSIYRLVMLAAKRAVELAEGLPSLRSTDSQIKPTTVALQEISEGQIRVRQE